MLFFMNLIRIFLDRLYDVDCHRYVSSNELSIDLMWKRFPNEVKFRDIQYYRKRWINNKMLNGDIFYSEQNTCGQFDITNSERLYNLCFNVLHETR